MAWAESYPYCDAVLPVRAYRIRQMAGTGLEPISPLWGIPTDELGHTMVSSGVKAILTCINTRKMDACFAGRAFDESFLSARPHGVDPCGENGEFHYFVYAGPMFTSEIAVIPGAIIVRDDFAYADLIGAACSDSARVASCQAFEQLPND